MRIFSKDYFFLDLNNVQALAFLKDENNLLNLYTSDSTGVNYTLSLENLVYDTNNIDFDVVCW